MRKISKAIPTHVFVAAIIDDGKVIGFGSIEREEEFCRTWADSFNHPTWQEKTRRAVVARVKLSAQQRLAMQDAILASGNGQRLTAGAH